MLKLQDTIRKQLVSLESDICTYKKLHPEDPASVKAVMLNLIKQVQKGFEKEMGSLGSNDVHTDRFSHGSKIRHIFHETLPNEISKIDHTEDDLRREIDYAIENLYGINGVLDTPFKAFEVLVKKQIEQLEQPINMCIDKVIDELSNAVRTCTRRIGSHPKFRTYIEEEIMDFIQANAKQQRSNILSLAKMEASYMNSMHYEFKNDKQSEIMEKLEQISGMYDDLNIEQRKALADRTAEYMKKEALERKNGTDIIREGNLSLGWGTIYRNEHWCILRSTGLTFAKVNNHADVFLQMTLGGVKFRIKEDDNNFATSESMIVLFRTDGANVHAGYKEIMLSFKCATDIRKWTKSLSRVIELNDKNRLDARQRDIDRAYNQITSYMRITKKTMCDMVPKAITLFVIRKLEEFVETDLLMILLDILNDENLNLFKADEEDVETFTKNTVLYETCKEALKVIMECNNS